MHAANPYHPADDGPYAPSAFAGRTDAYSKINQHLTDANTPQAAVMLGRRRVGKSALLWHFHEFFPPGYLSVYVPLRSLDPVDEAALVTALAQAIDAVMVDVPRPPMVTLPPLPDTPTLAVLGGTYLPALLETLRASQRLVLLLDDLDVLVDAVNAGTLPADLFTTFSGWIRGHEQLGMVVTLGDMGGEASSVALAPLVDLTRAHRLGVLTADEHALLLRIPDEYTLTDEAVEAAYRATGGDPLLAQRLGYALYEQGRVSITLEAVRAVLPDVVTAHHAAFRAAWGGLTLNERLVLTGISGLIYREPLVAVTPERVNRWLATHGYPLDGTATRAALRGVEYAGLVQVTGEGVTVAAGLLQTWLLQHAQLDPNGNEANRPAVWRVILVGGVVVALVVLAVVVGWEAAANRDPMTAAPPPPTVTLENPG
jgi:hypothetical protein